MPRRQTFSDAGYSQEFVRGLAHGGSGRVKATAAAAAVGIFSERRVN